MNKLFTRISMALVGIAMAVGVGVASGVKTEARGVEAANDPTASVTISTYATAHSWNTGSTKYLSVPIDSHSNISITGSTNTGKYYTKSPAGIRMYQTESPTLTISVDAGYSLSKVKVSYNVSNTGTLVYNDTNRASGAEISISGTSITYSVGNTTSATNGQCAISAVSVWYSENSYSKPLLANPTLSPSGSASITVGQNLSLGVTTNPVDTDEAITVTSADPTKVSVSGESSPYTITGLAITDSPVNVTVAGAKGVYSSTIAITVTAAPKVADDKVLTTTALGLTGDSYEINNGTHTYQSVNYVTNQVNYTQGIQFQKNTGYIYNSNSLFEVNSVAAKIKAITIVLNPANKNDSGKYGVPTVYEGSSANPDTVVTVSGTFAPTGINKYVLSGNNAFFKIAEKTNNAAMHIDQIIIELVDNTTSDLNAARTGASAILTGLNGLCGTGGTGVDTEEKWAEINSSLTSLSDGAKAILKNAQRIRIDNLTLGSAIIESAMYRYDYCVNKFHYTPVSNITSASVAVVAQPINAIASSSTTTVVIIISAVSLIAVSSYFVIRRRKENN